MVGVRKWLGVGSEGDLVVVGDQGLKGSRGSKGQGLKGSRGSRGQG